MLSQPDDSFKHISSLCKRRCHCCSAVYAAANSSFEWRRNGHSAEQQGKKEAIKVCRIKSRSPTSPAYCISAIGSSATPPPFSLRGSSTSRNHREVPTMKKTSASCSTMYLRDHQPGAQSHARPWEWHLSGNRAGLETALKNTSLFAQPELQANPFNPVQYT